MNNDLIKVTLKAVRSPGRVMYALPSRFRGFPMRAPSGGIVIQGYPYQSGEVIPVEAIYAASQEELDQLTNRLREDKKERESRKPGPGQANLPGMEEPDQDMKDRERREKALTFSALDSIPQQHPSFHPEDKETYTKMYQWMMEHYKPWYKNLTDEQHAMATWDRTVRISEMNKYLRHATYSWGGGYSHRGDAIEKAIRAFDSLVDDAPPLEQDTLVYKGSGWQWPAFQVPFKKGDVFTHNQIASTSLDPKTSVSGFLGSDTSGNPKKFLMRIVLPKGTRAAGVTAQQIYKHGKNLKGYLDSPGSYEQELTLPRDTQYRIVSEPHDETFKYGNDTKVIRVADFEILPQPSPEEAPQLPHADIHSWNTGGSSGYYPDGSDPYALDEDEEEDDPWEDSDPDDMKNDKMSDLESLISDYEDNPAHDREALQKLKDLKDDLDQENHTDYGDPDEFEEAMTKILKGAQKVIDQAPDHSDELWEAFEPRKEAIVSKYMSGIDHVINEFQANHDTTNTEVARTLSSLNMIRDRMKANAAGGNLKEDYANPDEFEGDLDKNLIKAKKISELAHELYAEQKSGKPPLFMGKKSDGFDIGHWINAKKGLDQNLLKIRETDPAMADRLQALWDKATHSILPGYEANQLMTNIRDLSGNILNGVSPDYSDYGHKSLGATEKIVDRKAMMDKSVLENLERARSLGLFQGKKLPTGYMMEWAKKKQEFDKNLSDYRSQQEVKGERISSDADRLQNLWDQATKELPPEYGTTYSLGTLVSASNNLKTGHVPYFGTTIDDVENEINNKLSLYGTPAAQLKIKKEKFDQEYKKAFNAYKDSPYYDAQYQDFHDRFKEYIKSHGVEPKDVGQLPLNVQEEIFNEATELVEAIKSASKGYLKPRDIWAPPDKTKEKTSTGLSGIFQGQPMPIGYAGKWLKFKHAFEGHIKELENKGYNNPEKDPERVEKLKNLWHSITHDLPANDYTQHLMGVMGTLALDLSNGYPIEYGILDVKNNYQNYLANNPPSDSLAPSDIFRGQPLPTGYVDKWLTHKDDFKSSIEKFKNKFGVSDGSSVASETEKLEKLWHTITHDLPPDDHTAHLMGMVIDTAHKMPDLPYASGELISRMVSGIESSVSQKIAVQKKIAAKGVPDDLKYKAAKSRLLQEFGQLMSEYGNTPYYNTDHHLGMNDLLSHTLDNYSGDQQIKRLKMIVKRAQSLVEGAPGADYIAHAPIEEPKEPEQEPMTFDDAYRGAQKINKQLYNYENMPFSDPTKSDKIKKRYDDLREEWIEDPTNDIHYMAQLTHLGNDLDEIVFDHSHKIGKIADHVEDIGPKIQYKYAAKLMGDKFPYEMNQFHLDMANYQLSPHYSESHYNVLKDIYDGVARDYANKYDLPATREDIKSLLNLTKEAATNHDKLPYQKLIEKPEETLSKTELTEKTTDSPEQEASNLYSDFPDPVKSFLANMDKYKKTPHYDPDYHAKLSGYFATTAKGWANNQDPDSAQNSLQALVSLSKQAVETGPIKHPDEAHEEPDKPSGASPEPAKRPKSGPPRVTYESFVRHIRYARDRRVSYAWGTEHEDPTPEHSNWGNAVALNSLNHVMGPGRDPEHLKRIYNWQIGHYAGWNQSLNKDEKEMADWHRPIKISLMNKHLRGGMSSSASNARYNGWKVQDGIQVMDGMIRAAPRLTNDMIAYRGVASRQPLYADKKPGDIVSDRAYASSTPDLETARYFALGDENHPHSTIMRILLPKGTKAAGVTAHQLINSKVPFEHVQAHPLSFEHELVLPRDSQYKVVSHPYVKNIQVRRADGSMIARQHHFIDVEHIPQVQKQHIVKTYARDDLNKVTLNGSRRILYAGWIKQKSVWQPPAENEVLHFAPEGRYLNVYEAQDQPYFTKMHQWQVGHYGDYLRTLSEKEHRMLDFHRPVKISEMNYHIRRGNHENNTLPQFEKYRINEGINLMDGIIAKAPPLKNDLIAYRGLRHYHANRNPGDIIHEPGYASTSLNPLISASGFSRGADAQSILKIHIPKGTHLGPVTADQIMRQNLTQHDEPFKVKEQELLLGRGHGFRVLKPIQYDPKTFTKTLEVELVPPHQVPKPSTQVSPQTQLPQFRLNYEKIIRHVYSESLT